MVTVRPLTERDLPEAQRIIRDAFGTFLGVPDLETFRFPPYAQTRFGTENVASFAAERDGALLGSNFATHWGSVGFFGPLSTRPDLWDAGIGQLLVTAACDAFEGWGIRHAGLFTFAQSAKPEHVEQLRAVMSDLIRLLDRCGVNTHGAKLYEYPVRRSVSSYPTARDGAPRVCAGEAAGRP